jgi:NSS family neurotransmitter:Na+ symporter
MATSEKSVWDSNISFILAMIGSAVGLGNIWRFPNVLYSNGGGSFMIPYIVSLFILGISFVLVEYAVGFRFKTSLSKIFFSIKSKLEPIAWFIVLVVFLITTYYVCVVGWDLIYLGLSFVQGWGANPDVFFTVDVLHASDSLASAEREINIYFKPEEIYDNWQSMSEIIAYDEERYNKQGI